MDLCDVQLEKGDAEGQVDGHDPIFQTCLTTMISDDLD
jgi:hypothetical protein